MISALDVGQSESGSLCYLNISARTSNWKLHTADVTSRYVIPNAFSTGIVHPLGLAGLIRSGDRRARQSDTEACVMWRDAGSEIGDSRL